MIEIYIVSDPNIWVTNVGDPYTATIRTLNVVLKNNNKNHSTLAHFLSKTKCCLGLLFSRNIQFNNATSNPWTWIQ